MDKEQEKIVASINKLVTSIKKDKEYIERINEQLKNNNNSFDNIGMYQSAYNANVRNYIEQRSSLIDILADDSKFELWKEHAPKNIKENLFTLAHNHDLVITEKELSIAKREDIDGKTMGFKKTFTILPSYSDEFAKTISQKITDAYSLDGYRHLKMQELARDVIAQSSKIPAFDYHGGKHSLRQDNYSNILTSLFKDVNSNNDNLGGTFWDDFKLAAKNNEVQHEQGKLFMNMNIQNKTHKVQILFNEQHQFTGLTFVPQLNNVISSIREKAQSQQDNQLRNN